MSKSGSNCNKVPKQILIQAMMCLHVRQGGGFTDHSLQRAPCALGLIITVISHIWIKHQGHRRNAVMRQQQFSAPV